MRANASHTLLAENPQLFSHNPTRDRSAASDGIEHNQAASSDFVGSPKRRSNIVQIAADGPLKPGGLDIIPHSGIDPLDPNDLNKPINLSEQQAIADTMNMIMAGRLADLPLLYPHRYKNNPDRETGAVLPTKPDGYTTYYVRPSGAPPGEARIVMDKQRNIFYSNNHYKSFYPVDVVPNH